MNINKALGCSALAVAAVQALKIILLALSLSLQYAIIGAIMSLCSIWLLGIRIRSTLTFNNVSP